jgi:hypothetical protein
MMFITESFRHTPGHRPLRAARHGNFGKYFSDMPPPRPSKSGFLPHNSVLFTIETSLRAYEGTFRRRRGGILLDLFPRICYHIGRWGRDVMTDKILPTFTNTTFLAETPGPSVRTARLNTAYRESDDVISVDVRIKCMGEPVARADKQHRVGPIIEDAPTGLVVDTYV